MKQIEERLRHDLYHEEKWYSRPHIVTFKVRLQHLTDYCEGLLDFRNTSKREQKAVRPLSSHLAMQATKETASSSEAAVSNVVVACHDTATSTTSALQADPLSTSEVTPRAPETSVTLSTMTCNHWLKTPDSLVVSQFISRTAITYFVLEATIGIPLACSANTRLLATLFTLLLNTAIEYAPFGFIFKRPSSDIDGSITKRRLPLLDTMGFAAIVALLLQCLIKAPAFGDALHSIQNQVALFVNVLWNHLRYFAIDCTWHKKRLEDGSEAVRRGII